MLAAGGDVFAAGREDLVLAAVWQPVEEIPLGLAVDLGVGPPIYSFTRAV